MRIAEDSRRADGVRLGVDRVEGLFPMSSTEIEPLGDSAFLANFARESAASGWAAAVRALHHQGVTDVVLAYRTVAVFADPAQVDLVDLESRLRGIVADPGSHPSGRLAVIPVLYDGADLTAVAARLELSPAEVIALHTSVEYSVHAIGFLPGFPYAGELPAALAGLPRRETPRLPRAGGLGGDRGPADGHLSPRLARRLAFAGKDATLHRRPRRRILPHRGRRPAPVRADLRLGIRGQKT